MKKYITYLMVLFFAFCCNLNKSYCQSTSTGTATPGTPNEPFGATDYLGWDGTVTRPLQIRTQANYRINFYTDSLFRVVIDSATGFVGFGIHFNSPTAPVYLLDADSGDVNIGHNTATSKFGYRIDHNYVLWNNGNTSNIYVGVNAGKPNAAASAINNTFCGYDAGNMDSTGFSNSFKA